MQIISGIRKKEVLVFEQVVRFLDIYFVFNEIFTFFGKHSRTKNVKGMKTKLLFIVFMGAFLLSATNVMSQETQTEQKVLTKEEQKAAKIAEKEAKRKAKEEAKAAKEETKAEEAMEKAEKKAVKRDETQAKFDEFLAKWEPVDLSGVNQKTMPNVYALFKGSNELFTTMKNVDGYIGFIQIETTETTDEAGIPVTEMKVMNTNTNEPMEKNDALKTYATATLDLTAAALTATNVAMSGPLALTDLASDPIAALSMGKKIKKTIEAVKMSVTVIPLIKAKIGDNVAALKQTKNN